MLKMSTRAFAMVAAALGLAVTVSSAHAGSNCVNYAKLSLKQQQENARKNCGQSGPEWNADMKALLAWCGSKSPQDVQAMLNMRKEALNKCQ